MIVFGLTGSIGMGKSRAAAMMEWMGVSVHDSDKAVHAAMIPGGPAFAAVAKAFPKSIEAGAVNRATLGAIVFADQARRKQLEAILHPEAQRSQAAFVARCAAQGAKACVLEIPLLFETGAEARVDYTICVSAPPHIQKKRVMARPDMTEDKFARILASQMPDAEKRGRSNFVVETGRGYIRTFLSLRRILKQTGVL